MRIPGSEEGGYFHISILPILALKNKIAPHYVSKKPAIAWGPDVAPTLRIRCAARQIASSSAISSARCKSCHLPSN
jgi:hypothetical protein